MCSAGNGILPFEPAETGEIRVGRVQNAVVFHGECCQVGVGKQIAHRISAAQHLLKKSPVLVGRLNDSDTRLIEPALHTFGGLLERERTLVQPGIGANANESVHHWPA